MKIEYRGQGIVVLEPGDRLRDVPNGSYAVCPLATGFVGMNPDGNDLCVLTEPLDTVEETIAAVKWVIDLAQDAEDRIREEHFETPVAAAVPLKPRREPAVVGNRDRAIPVALGTAHRCAQ